MKVVGLCGSLREGSYTRQALLIALEAARQAGATVELLDLRALKLPFCGQDEGKFPDVARLRETVRQADALLLGTPEYHNSYSGALKNAIDLLGFDEVEGKLCGLLSVAGGSSGLGPLSHLRLVCRGLRAWVLPQQVALPRPETIFQGGKLTDLDLKGRLEELGCQLVRFARLHADRA